MFQNCCKAVTSVGKRQHLCRCRPSVIAHVVCRGPWVGLPPFSTAPSRKRRGRWRARWRNHCSFDAALPLENAGASWRAIAGVFPTAPGRALREPSVLPAPASPIGEGAQAGGIGPRMAKLLAGSSYWPRGGAPAPPECERLRFLPAAGAASDPTRMTPHESALWRTGHH